MASRVFEEILSRSRKNRELIGISKYGDVDTLLVGDIVAFNENLLACQSISRYGKADGLYIEEVENIETIETDTKYLDAIQYLMESQTQEGVFDTFELPDKEEWQEEIIASIIDKAQMVAISTDKDYERSGFITDVDDTYFKIITVSNIGDDMCIQIFKNEELSNIQIGTQELLKRQKLFERNQKAGLK